MNNNNWVCFRCRRAKRQEKVNSNTPKCTFCSEEMFLLGYKVAIPKHTDKKSWKILQEESYRRRICMQQWKYINAVEKKHLLEQKIIRLQQLAQNKYQNKQINKLKKQAEEINNTL